MPLVALGLEVVSEDSGHTVTPMAPNMCITPAAPSPLPMPYPITGTSSSLDPGTDKVKVSGKLAMNFQCKVKKIDGNQPGTQKDITTMQTAGHAWPLPVPAVMVHFEGGPVSVTSNPGFANSM